MKKIFFAMCIALMSLNASAQKDEQNVGAHILYGTDAKNIGLGVKYQRNMTDAIRLEAVGDYYLKTDGFTMFDVNVNGHYLFPLTDKVIAYPLVGINYTLTKVDIDDEYGDADSTDGSLGLNIGGGVQYQLTDKIRIGAELKYQTIKGFNTAVLGASVTFTL